MKRLPLLASFALSVLYSLHAAAAPTPPPVPDQKTAPQKTTWTATILPFPTENPIQGLQLHEKNLSVQLIPRDEKLRPFVEVKGDFARTGWTLYVALGEKETPVKLSSDGKFRFFAILTSRYSDVSFVARGAAEGEVQNTKIQIFSPEAQEYRIGSDIGEFTLSIGGGSFSYFQTGFGNFASKNAVQEISYLSPTYFSTWNAIFTLRSPVWTVSSSPIDASPDLVRGNLDVKTHVWTAPTMPIKVGARAGLSYVNMLSYDAPFGFTSIFSPDMGVDAVYHIDDGQQAFLTLIYSPLGSLFGSEKCWELQAGYKFQLPNLHMMTASISSLSLAFKPVERAEVRARLLALMIGYSF